MEARQTSVSRRYISVTFNVGEKEGCLLKTLVRGLQGGLYNHSAITNFTHLRHLRANRQVYTLFQKSFRFLGSFEATFHSRCRC